MDGTSDPIESAEPVPEPVFPSMEGPDGKLRRAKQHAETLKAHVALTFDLDHHRITVEDDPDACQYVFRVFDLQLTDPDWSLFLGDCVHNLRSALDHLAFQLAILGKGLRALTDKEARACGFPIFEDPTEFPNPRKTGPIRLLRPGEQTRITELQPFNAQDASIWGSSAMFPFRRWPPASIPEQLRRLGELDNIDKHRRVHPTWRAAQWWRSEPAPVPLIGSTAFAGALENGAEVGRWHYAAPRPVLPAEMDMYRYFPIGISLGEPFMYDALELIDCLVGAVEVVLSVFRPCVESGDAAVPLTAIL